MRFTSALAVALLAACTTVLSAVAISAVAGSATPVSVARMMGGHPAAAVPFVDGGTPAPAETWSAIQYVNGARFCSASLIDRRWVATATHCVRGGVSGMAFRVGSNQADSGGSTHNAVEIHRAPGADLTLVRISPPAAQTPLRLPDRALEPGATVNLFGFGATGVGGAQSPVLKLAVTRLIGPGRDHLGAPALNLERVSGIAQPGDSGGPAVIDGVQYGVASTSDLRATAQYTSLFHLRGWIRATTGL